jgi:hypothetical protein
MSENDTGMILAKIRSTDRLMGVAGSTIEPLRLATDRAPNPFAVDGEPRWFMVQTDPSASPWDQAHDRVADQLGIDAGDVLFAEPEMQHSIFAPGNGEPPAIDGFAAAAECVDVPQDKGNGKQFGKTSFWHLDAQHSQLAQARKDVDFDPNNRTRIAHLDTGFSPDHESVPAHINTELQRNLVDASGAMLSASDPGRFILPDNSGHGTGTISILAGGEIESRENRVLGGAYDAEIVPIRVSSRVVLLRTSALAQAVLYAADVGCAVATLSMGGLPSKAWAEAVDEAYENGLCLVAAGGNTIGELPPRSLVYPARYERVIAVTGVMAGGKPYENLKGKTLEGSFGPESAMGSAIAAYTPNIPWGVFGCDNHTRLDGEGTSSATPQVAAAAALWIEKHKQHLPASWRRVEAVRHALFTSAKAGRNKAKFGNGILQANDALAIAPNLGLSRSAKSTHRWSFLRMLTGLFIDGTTSREEMFNLEFEQLWLMNTELADLVQDPDGQTSLTKDQAHDIIEAVLADDRASQALKDHLVSRHREVNRSTTSKPLTGAPPEPKLDTHAPLTPPEPTVRRLRVFAKDPTLAASFATASLGSVTLEVPWEEITPTADGFAGEYVRVVDDAVTPIKTKARQFGLDHPNLLAQDGWEPSLSNRHFHQQMLYAVSTKTIDYFNRALGRPVQWHAKPRAGKGPKDDGFFTRQLELRPHALQAANAYYSPAEIALNFGYFDPKGAGEYARVYTCLSQDIVAHETTHAILDGMHRLFAEPTNVDVLAFHEAFADLVALLQGFDLSELLRHEIAKSRGDLQADTLLGKIAVQFGTASRGREALRSAIGLTADGEWIRSAPDPSELDRRTTPHDRGAILVSAVFDALIAIYESRTGDLFRIASGGTGRLPDGEILPDLVNRLADEAAKSARHLLRMCIRALDYLPPIDITFFDFLRALVTADIEFVPEDKYHYRLAVVESFINRGIVPGPNDAQGNQPLRDVSVESLAWSGFSASDARGTSEHYATVSQLLNEYAAACDGVSERRKLFETTRSYREKLYFAFRDAFKDSPQFRNGLGLSDNSFNVHALRRAIRERPGGGTQAQAMVSLVQAPEKGKSALDALAYVNGVTLVMNLNSTDERPAYRIVKGARDRERYEAMARFAAANEADPLRALYLGSGSSSEGFAALHALADSHAHRRD